MNKQSLITILLTVLMSMTGAKVFATTYAYDIEVANDDGKNIYYKWTNNNTELAVTSIFPYDDETWYGWFYMGDVVIPASVVYNGITYPAQKGQAPLRPTLRNFFNITKEPSLCNNSSSLPKVHRIYETTKLLRDFSFFLLLFRNFELPLHTKLLK